MRGVPLSKTPTYVRLGFPHLRDEALQEIEDMLLSLVPGETRHIQITMEGCLVGGFHLEVETTSPTRITGTGHGEQEDPEFFHEVGSIVLEKQGAEWFVTRGVTDHGEACEPKHVIFVYPKETD